MIDAIIALTRGVGRNGGWASLVTGNPVDSGPDLSLFVKNRADAYRLVDWVTPKHQNDRILQNDRLVRVDRAFVDYRPSEPNRLQVKLIVEEEYEEVLQRLSTALFLRDGYLDAKLIQWAIQPEEIASTAAAYQQIERMRTEAASG